MNEYFTDEKLNFVATGFKSFITLHVLTKYVESLAPSEIVHLTDKKREALLQLALLNRNISGMHGIGALSFVHSRQHIRKTQEALEEIAPPISKTQFE